MEGMHMTESSETPELPSWQQQYHQSTDGEDAHWSERGMPRHIDVVAGFLASNDFVYGDLDRAEIFRLDAIRKEEHSAFSNGRLDLENMLRLHYAEPSPLRLVNFTMAHPPIGSGDIVEVNYNVRLQAILREMSLDHIHVLHGSEHDDSKIVFEARQLYGPAMRRQIRVVRVTVLDSEFGTWEKLSETVYPGSLLDPESPF
jgi:hypothetical protein